MPDLLLELRSEEIPARMQRKAAGDLRKLVTDALVDAGLTYEGAQEYWTPRRLTLDLRGLTARSRDVREEIKGPSTSAPEAAVQGFLRKASLASVDQAHVHSDPRKGDFYVAHVVKPGRAAEAIIAEVMPGIVRDFPWPKSMRWGAASAKPGSLRWVRPLQSILCTFGPETEEPVIVPFTIDGIASGNTTVGHRFHAPGAITVKRFDDYAAKLEAAHVVLDAERRKAIIRADAANLAFASGLDLVEDETLLEDVSGLVEWPVVLMGEFDEAFLEIPAEVIRLTIRANQKCFVTRPAADTEALAPRFLLTANIDAKDGGADIARGNGKVVRARLSDALYFWRTDQADLPDLDELKESAKKFGLDLKKPLDQRMARLDHLNVTFQAKLGTQGQRVERIRDLARKIAPLVNADSNLAARAAVLAKADLQTEVVNEFPELQGLIGQRYAVLQGEHQSVAVAIENQYKPVGSSDSVSSEPVSVAVSLADKLDTLIGFWVIDEKPTGSKDPFALRRAALGIIRIIIESRSQMKLQSRLLDPLRFARIHKNMAEQWQLNREQASNNPRLSIRFTQLAQEAGEIDARFRHNAPAQSDEQPLLDDLLRFLHDRLKVYLRDKGARHDLIDAVLAASFYSPLWEGHAGAVVVGSTPLSPSTLNPSLRADPPRKASKGLANDDLLSIVRRVEALGSLLDTADGKNLLAGTKRAANILAAEERKGTAIAVSADPALFTGEAEHALFDAVDRAEAEAAEAIGREDFAAAMVALSALRAPVDSFFEQVLVNAEDAAVRANRLALLARIRAATGQVADFSKIAG